MHYDHITLVKYIEELHTIYPIYENVCNQGSNKIIRITKKSAPLQAPILLLQRRNQKIGTILIRSNMKNASQHRQKTI
jgi:hypothetical protein